MRDMVIKPMQALAGLDLGSKTLKAATLMSRSFF